MRQIAFLVANWGQLELDGCLTAPDFFADRERFRQLPFGYNQVDLSKALILRDGHALFSVCRV